jgi:peptidylamidoglycolate lyase
VRVSYEAWPTGFVIARRLGQLKVHCTMLAPSLIPVRSGKRIKTDRRDELKLRAGCGRRGRQRSIARAGIFLRTKNREKLALSFRAPHALPSVPIPRLPFPMTTPMPHRISFFAALFLATPIPLRAGEPHHEVVKDWPSLPEGHVLGLCAGVGVDSHNHVFVFHRRERVWSTPFPSEPIAGATVSVIDAKIGKLVASWGAGLFIMPHGLTIDREDNVWLTDVGLYQVFKFTHDGKLLLTLGERAKPGDDRSHFNLPTDVAVLADGSFYVSDGYKNARVVKFAADGRYEFEWGGKGDAPGKFNLPHGIAVDSHGRVIVCDRTNSRLQVFDARGKFLTQWKGAHIGRPYGVAVGTDDHVFSVDGGDPTAEPAERGKVVELDAEGRVLDTFGSPGKGPGQFQLGHDIAVGPDGAVYVAEGSGKRVQKFVRKP